MDTEIYLYDNGVTNRLTSDGNYKTNTVWILRGKIVWQQQNTQGIHCYDNGTIIDITGGYNSDPQINDRGQIVWIWSDGTLTNYQLYLYDNGTITKITDSSNNYRYKSPKINNSGEIAWIENDGVWLYRNGNKLLLNDYITDRWRQIFTNQ